MDNVSDFDKAWRTRFSTDDPPDLGVDTSDPESVNRALDKCKGRIEDYKLKLHQQEFIHGFLWDMLHRKKPSLPNDNVSDNVFVGGQSGKQGNGISNAKLVNQSSLERRDAHKFAYTIKPAIPVNTDRPASAEPTIQENNTRAVGNSDSFKARQKLLQHSINRNLADHDRDKMGAASKSSENLSQPSRGNYVNLDYSEVTDKKPLERVGSDGSISRWSSKKHPKPVPAPRPSIAGPTMKEQAVSIAGEFQERLSFKKAPSPVNIDREEEKGSSKFQLPRKNHQYESVHLHESGTNNNVQPPLQTFQIPQKCRTGSADSNESIPSPGFSSFKPLPSAKEVEMPHREEPPPVYKRSDSSTSTSLADMSVRPRTDGKTPKLSARSESLDSNVAPESPKLPKKTNKALGRVKEHIYDAPVPAKRDDESDSSSDEEPIYFNILLLKQKTMQKNHSMFSSLDNQKQHVENQARRMSKKFATQSVDLTGKMRPLPPKVAPPLMKPIKEKGGAVISGVTVTDSDKASESPTDPETIDGRCDSVDSLGSIGSTDSAKELEGIWKKRQSMMMATGDTDSTGTDELDMEIPVYQESEKTQMRKWVVNSILESEKVYVRVLDVLQQYMKSFRAVAKSDNQVIPEEDIDVIFYKITDLHRVHFNFIHELEPVVENWTADSQIAPQFKILAVEELPLAGDYLKNYHRAITHIHKLAEKEEYKQFIELTTDIKVVGIKGNANIEELLHKPVVRFQRNTLVLHDLIRCTPTAHPDYDLLQKTLKLAQEFLESFQSPQDKDSPENQRYLARYSPIVELVGNGRKLRHVFLFNDIIICAKQRISGKKITYDVKWAISLFDLILDQKACAQEEKKIAEHHRGEIENLQRRVSELQGELKAELKKLRHDGQRKGSIRSHNKNIEKIRKKLMTQETQLVLASPHLVFRLSHKKKKNQSFTLLMASDYERINWTDTIDGLLTKVLKTSDWRGVDLGELINTVKLPKMNLGLLDNDELSNELEEEHLFGSLYVTIHRLQGLSKVSDTFCCLELDSFGHFFMKAKTHIISGAKEPVWNDDFEIELEGAQTLRILVYKSADSDVLIGKCALELSKAWLRGDFQEKSISLNDEMSVCVSLKYVTREQTLRRKPSNVQGGLFGVHISQLAKREGCKIPAIVETCVREIEKRGIDDLGIYRVSGLSSEIQRMKKAFEKNTRGASELAKETDVNALSGLLKLYFRELPEALFTDKLYPQLVDSMGLSDPEAKERCLQSLKSSLPEPNRTVVNYMIAHLIKISDHEVENKMSLHNLATVFGPTLLRPAAKDSEPVTLEMFSAHAQDAMTQTGILHQYLTLHKTEQDSTRL